jgi:cytochrome P450
MSMQSMASPEVPIVTRAKRTSLQHIPGDEGWPMVGRTLAVLADPKGEVERMAAKYGLVYRSRVLGETSISLLGPEANELLLFDQSKLFSSTHGWGTILDRLFPRGLMLLDFEEHRLHRRALSVAFKSGPMKSYLGKLDAGIAARVAQWKAQPGPMLFYPAMKQLTLDLAATSFLGAEHRTRGRRDHARVRRHGRGRGRPDPQALARHADGARRQGARPHRRLFLRTNSDPSRQRRRGPVLAAVPGDP